MKSLTLWFSLFVLVAYAWHWSKAALVEPKPTYYIEYNIADLNRDGWVNMLDQSIVAANWGEHKSVLTYTDANNPQGLPVIYEPNMPAREFEEHLR